MEIGGKYGLKVWTTAAPTTLEGFTQKTGSPAETNMATENRKGERLDGLPIWQRKTLE
jgi:hypothetical protein